jgi:hypothetical protein
MDPDYALRYLTKTYKLRDVCALEIAEIKLAQLTFNPSESVMTFVNKVRTLQKESTPEVHAATPWPWRRLLEAFPKIVLPASSLAR